MVMIYNLWHSVNDIEDSLADYSRLDDSLDVGSETEDHHHACHESYENSQKLSDVILFVIVARVCVTFLNIY